MRLDNIKVTFKSKLPINEPNRNGIMYTRDAVIKAYEESRNRVLIEFSNVEGEFVPIGIALILIHGTLMTVKNLQKIKRMNSLNL